MKLLPLNDTERIVMVAGSIIAAIAALFNSTSCVLFGWLLVWIGNESYRQRQPRA